jgi:hypothetical protein
MRYFVPDIRVASELPPQSRPEDKLGGLPWGLGKRWPTCSHCGKSQSLLAQFLHDPVRLDLGKSGRVLSVFQCNHDPGGCPTWEGGGGANACFVTDSEDIEAGLSPLPTDKPPLEREVRIVTWLERDDGVPESLAVAFFSDETYLALPEAETRKVSSSTRLGGVPFWLQSADESPRDGWRFVGQLATTYDFFCPPIIVDEGITIDRSRREGRTHYADGPIFGDGGYAYLFLRPGTEVPEGWFFWQC